ncbi:MAG: RidA family protein [Pseudomonadota bacterium]
MLTHLTPDSIRAPFAKYSHAVEVPEGMRLVVCSGQLGITVDDEIPANTEAQTRLCFDNIRAILGEAGMDLSNIVRINAYVTGREHLKPYMKVRDELFSAPAPASTLMIVSGFAREEFTVEIEALAAGLPR